MRKIIYICLAIAVASCGIYKPYARPEVSTDGLFGVEYTATDTTTIASIEWREFFTDANLQELISCGLENNSDMQAAHWRIKEAEAALKSARLAFLPSFNLSPTGGISSFDGTSGAWTYSAPIAASWQIDIFGGINNAKRKAKAVYEQSVEYRQAVRAQLISAIANYYYTLVMLDSQREVTRLTADSFARSAETMRAMMEAGMTNMAAVAQMEAAAHSAEASLFDIELQIREVENGLCALLGQTPHAIERSSFAEQSFPEELAAGVPVQLLANRPDVRIAEYNLVQAFYSTAAARSALYPTLTLSGLLGWTNNAGNIVTNPGGLLLLAAASLTAPIFNSGKARAGVKIAEAQHEEALISFKQSLLNAGAEVNNSLSLIQSSRAKQEWRAKQIDALERAVESTELLMQYGSTTYLEVLTAQQNLLSGRIAEINDYFEEVQGIINLYTALGGGREVVKAEEQHAK